nr:Uncharacterised protein [Providencia rettgeri]
MKIKLLAMVAGVILLNGCANEPKPLYNWDGYQTTVYQYYQQTETGPQEQIQALKKEFGNEQSKRFSNSARVACAFRVIVFNNWSG